MSSTPLRGIRHPEPTGPRACSAQNKAWAALGQLELVFNSGTLPLVLCKLGKSPSLSEHPNPQIPNGCDNLHLRVKHVSKHSQSQHAGET